MTKNKIERIDVFKSSISQYGVLYHFGIKLYEALLRAGYKARLFESHFKLSQITLEPLPHLTIGFNGVPAAPSLKTKEGSPDTEAICDLIRVPHVSCLVDPPFRFFYLTRSPYSIIGCDDLSGCEMLRQMGFSKTVFFPHAVEKELSPDPKEERIYDVVMLASYIDFVHRKKKWRKIYPKWIWQIMEEAIEITLSDQETAFINAFRKVFIDHKRRPEEMETFNLFEVFAEMEMAIKGMERFNMLKSIQDVDVHLFGSNEWKSHLGKKLPHVILHDNVDYAQALEIMKKSKIVLNCSIKNKNGAHERIFSGLACGALVVTGENIYLRHYFQDGQNILFYRYSESDLLNQKIHYYLAHENERKQVAEGGREVVMAHHTWDHRVKTLIQDVTPILNAF